MENGVACPNFSWFERRLPDVYGMRWAAVEKPFSIGVRGDDPGVLDRKRWIDDVINMAALRARILAGLRF